LNRIDLIQRKKSIFVVASMVLAGCVFVNPHQELLENSHQEKIGVCKNESAQFGRYDEETNKQLDPENISVMNWNIHKNKGENWANDFNSLSKNQDIIIIQEAYLDDRLQKALAQQDRFWSLNAAFYLNEKPSGVLMASTFKPYYSCGYRVLEPIIRLPKSVLFHYYKLKGHKQTLLVVDIHGINFTLGVRVYQRQIEMLEKIAAQHKGPMIIAGDFNNWNNERKAIVSQMQSVLSLKSSKIKKSKQTHFFGNVIDHIFYRGLVPLFSTSKKVSSSDHNPILIQFRLAATKES
jgi:endonuclease/exonuclease/phosphatase (EEP) superfamily protein YafD